MSAWLHMQTNAFLFFVWKLNISLGYADCVSILTAAHFYDESSQIYLFIFFIKFQLWGLNSTTWAHFLSLYFHSHFYGVNVVMCVLMTLDSYRILLRRYPISTYSMKTHCSFWQCAWLEDDKITPDDSLIMIVITVLALSIMFRGFCQQSTGCPLNRHWAQMYLFFHL